MGDRRKSGARGVGELVTMQTLVRAELPRERHQQVTRFVRLENERARLERELGIWEQQKAAIERRLDQIYQQIDAMRSLLLEDRPARPKEPPPTVKRRKPAPADAVAPSVKERRDISIDY